MLGLRALERGLRAGQQIELRYLIRAAAVKSANDAATTAMLETRQNPIGSVVVAW